MHYVKSVDFTGFPKHAFIDGNILKQETDVDKRTNTVQENFQIIKYTVKRRYILIKESMNA
jgi:hypothetical protein